MADYHNFSNIFDILTFFLPFILIAFITLMSIFNQDLKALVLILGLMFMSYFHKEINTYYIHDMNKESEYKNMCTLFNIIDPPANTVALISFIFIYFLLPMIHNNHYNPLIITTFIVILSLEMYFKTIVYKCFTPLSIIISIIIGSTLGASLFYIIYGLGEKYYNLLYFNISKNNRVQCSREKQTEYQCNFVDDSGEPIMNEVTGLKLLNDTKFNKTLTTKYQTPNTADQIAQDQHNKLKTQLESIKIQLEDAVEEHNANHHTGL